MTATHHRSHDQILTKPDNPYLGDRLVLTDSGLETTLIFDAGFDLPEFASFPLLDTSEGRAALRDYYRRHIELAADHGVDIVLETPTWRASADWGATLGYDADELDRLNAAAIALVRDLRDEFRVTGTHVTVSGNLGPRGDGYDPGRQMSVDEAERFHRPQIDALAAAGAELVTALTMTYLEEAIGIARAAARAGVPAVISFTVETDGRLPSGDQLGEAITAVDAATGGTPVAYGINCAHPDHFASVLAEGDDWLSRIGLVRANASRMSHAELDEADELDAGDPVELGTQYAELQRYLPGLRVVGGCCGTDHGHIEQIAHHCLSSTVAGRATAGPR
jgi:homocysteine S-methyltransferase